MPQTATIRGTIRVDGHAVPDQDVLVISTSHNDLLAACASGPSGDFSCAVALPEHVSEVSVLAKIKAGVVTVVHSVVQVPQRVPLEINVDSSHRFRTLNGQINSSVGWPDYLNVFLDPVSIEGVPDNLVRFFNQKDHGIFDGHFIYTPVKATSFTFKVTPGVYKIGGDYIVLERPMLVDKDFQNYVVNKASEGTTGAELPGNQYAGFTLNVSGDVTVTLSLRTVEDQEL